MSRKQLFRIWLAAVVAAFVAIQFASCSRSTNPTDSQSGAKNTLFHTSEIIAVDSTVSAQDSTISSDPTLSSTTDSVIIRNRTNVPIDSVTFYVGSNPETHGAPSHSRHTYFVPDGITAVNVFGTNIPYNTPTVITLPNGSKVIVTWVGNIIVVADTAEMN